MGAVKLELHYPKSINGVTVDPQPDWSPEGLISELKSLELKLNPSSVVPEHFIKTRIREDPNAKETNKGPSAFVMRISDNETEDTESEDEEVLAQNLVVSKRFSCNELYTSGTDDSEDELVIEATQTQLMEKVGVPEVVLFELDEEHRRGIKEEIRNVISALETDLVNESERSTNALIQVEKYTEARREMDRKLDTQYQRKIAEALDNHLIAVQRDHEHRSQIEERRIRNDAAFEEAKRKEKALQEEKLRQEKAKAEAEARLEAARKRTEEMQKAALEAERRAVKEAAERRATETAKPDSAAVTEKEGIHHKMDANAEAVKEETEKGSSKAHSAAGSLLKVAESALRQEEERLRRYNELVEQNQRLKSASNKDFRSYERQIVRHIKQITGEKDVVRAKAKELMKIFNDPNCPQSISVAMFAKKVVSQCENPSADFGSTSFACAHVIVLVTSQVPLAMDLILAEFHKACIYTVPKYMEYSESAFKTKGAYYKMIGYQEEDGGLESTERYVERVESYLKLYAALVQTEADGVQNMHGLKEGWAWLARFLNALPANRYTATALEAFLKMAGFALFRKYKSQFMKILNIISRNFVDALEAQRDPKLNHVITLIKSYLGKKTFLQEPEGWRLQTSVLSDSCVTDSESGFYQQQYYHQPNRYLYQY
ncbi:PREDICTED: protein GLE1 [Nelumbo nucifera]|nr:PREDICTED: protein GLE1 [Nelumbo nucifera]XP_010248704.1 PREDICTED: protein GLE1 [Nelumbo nucifera]